jgi:hypothetical protein
VPGHSHNVQYGTGLRVASFFLTQALPPSERQAYLTSAEFNQHIPRLIDEQAVQ